MTNSRMMDRNYHLQERRPPFFARHPWIGLILFLFGVFTFSGFAINLQTHGPLYREDRVVALDVHEILEVEPASVTEAIHNTSFMLGREVVEGLGVLLIFIFIWKKRWRECWILILAIIGGKALWFVFSNLFQRPRPINLTPLKHLTGYGFPSSHSLNSILIFGLIAYVLIPYLHSSIGRTLVILSIILLVIYVGFGRIYTEGYYLTDVLAGYSLGTAWGALVATVVDWWFFLREKQQIKQSEQPI